MSLGVAIISLAITAFSANKAQQAQKQARQDSQRAAEEQEKARQEQKAQNAADAAEERRSQIREERIRRGKITQDAINSGTAASSGEAGAVGSLSTQLNNNIGINLGKLQTATNISTYSQNAANFNVSSQRNQSQASSWLSYGQAAKSITADAGSIFAEATK